MPPAFSVIIPVFNGASFLDEVLNRVTEEFAAPDEIIVIDDASTDQTGTIVLTRKGIVYSRNSANMGPATSRERGVALARNDNLLFLDADILIPTGFRDSLTAAWGQGESVLVGWLALRPLHETEFTRYKAAHMYAYTSRFLRNNPSGNNATFTTQCTALPRMIFKEYGGFNPVASRYWLEDDDLDCRLHQARIPIRMVPEWEVRHNFSPLLPSLRKLFLQSAWWVSEISRHHPQVFDRVGKTVSEAINRICAPVMTVLTLGAFVKPHALLTFLATLCLMTFLGTSRSFLHLTYRTYGVKSLVSSLVFHYLAGLACTAGGLWGLVRRLSRPKERN